MYPYIPLPLGLPNPIPAVSSVYSSAPGQRRIALQCRDTRRGPSTFGSDSLIDRVIACLRACIARFISALLEDDCVSTDKALKIVATLVELFS